MPTTFVFMRHAQGTHNVDTFRRGTGSHPDYLDAELTAIGIQQTMDTREKLKDITFDAIYCSPLRRCRTTLLGTYPKSVDLPVQLDDRLIEQPTGTELCNKRLEKSDIVPNVSNHWNMTNVSEVNPFKVCSLREDFEKIYEFTSMVQRDWPDGLILVVSHCGWINHWMRVYQDKHVILDNCAYIEATL